MNNIIKSALLFCALFFSSYSYSDWDDDYKNDPDVHASSCCSTCSPQYCIYVYCHSNPTTKILAYPNDQCVCDGAGGVLRYEMGVYTAAIPTYSTCVRGVYSSTVVGSTTYTAPVAGDYQAFDILCLNDDAVALSSVGLGIGKNYCEGEESSSIRRYTYAGTVGANPSTAFYNHIYFCADGTRDYAWQRQDVNNAGGMCSSSSSIGEAFMDIFGVIAQTAGSSLTPTPTPTNTPTGTPTPTPTPTVSIQLTAKIFLVGPYTTATGVMTTALNTNSMIPTAHPYGSAPFSHAGTETVAAGFFAANPTVVDWVLLELRNPADTVVASKAVFVTSNATLLGTDGSPTITFTGLGGLTYYVAIRHRNHIGVLTASTYTFVEGVTTDIDLTRDPALAANNYTGESGLKLLGGALGNYGMYGCDVNQDGWANYVADRTNYLLPQAACLNGSTATIVFPTYHNCDVNMNAYITGSGGSNDSSYCMTAIGSTTLYRAQNVAFGAVVLPTFTPTPTPTNTPTPIPNTPTPLPTIDISSYKIYSATFNSGSGVGGLNVTYDGGANFTYKTTANGLVSNLVKALKVNGPIIYAGTNDAGISLSLDSGATFPVSFTTANGLGSNSIRRIFLDPNGTDMYVATANGLAISNDGGLTFSNKTTANGLTNNSVTYGYAHGGIIYAGMASGGGLGISSDGGNTFTIKNTADGLGSGTIQHIIVAPNGNLLVATNAGLGVSTNGGVSFTNKTAGLASTIVLSVDVNSSGTIAVSTQGGIGISYDGGDWFFNKTTANGLGHNVSRMVKILDNGVVIAATYGGLSISNDGGVTFTNKTTANGLVETDHYDVGVSATGIATIPTPTPTYTGTPSPTPTNDVTILTNNTGRHLIFLSELSSPASPPTGLESYAALNNFCRAQATAAGFSLSYKAVVANSPDGAKAVLESYGDSYILGNYLNVKGEELASSWNNLWGIGTAYIVYRVDQSVPGWGVIATGTTSAGAYENDCAGWTNLGIDMAGYVHATYGSSGTAWINDGTGSMGCLHGMQVYCMSDDLYTPTPTPTPTATDTPTPTPTAGGAECGMLNSCNDAFGNPVWATYCPGLVGCTAYQTCCCTLNGATCGGGK